MDEFSLIRQQISPLSSAVKDLSLGLQDDACLIPKDDETYYAVSKDMICEDVHFLKDSSPENIASRVLRVNLSDMAAMGAEPKYYLLGLGGLVSNEWYKKFFVSLKKNQEEFGISLLGGDTIRSKKELFISLTVIGEVKKENVLLRKNAEIGDEIYVTGTIGDAGQGLKILRDNFVCENKKYFIERFNKPLPRVEFAKKIANLGVSKCAIDISDGFISDMNHICEASSVGAELYFDNFPIKKDIKDKKYALVCGDDYELIFTVPVNRISDLRKIASKTSVLLTKLGKVIRDKGVRVLDNKGMEMKLSEKGYRHF